MNEIIENRKKSEILAEELSKLNYGEFISHRRIASIIDEEYPSNRYSSEISKAKKILLKKYRKTMESIIGDGYRLVNPDEYVDHSLKHYKRGFKEMQKGYDVLEHAPKEHMSKEGLDAYRRVHDRTTILAASMKGVSVELKILGQKKHPLSI